jgi:hypothetical protein
VVCTSRGVIGFDTFGLGTGSGSSSKSSMEKSKSWVDIGGKDSIIGGGGTVVSVRRCGTEGTASDASSRETCVLLSKKSSHPSPNDCDIVGVGMLLDIVLDGKDELDFDAGSPGSLKPGFWFICGFAFETGGVGFLGKLAGGTRPGIVGSLNPVCDVSRDRLGGV